MSVEQSDIEPNKLDNAMKSKLINSLNNNFPLLICVFVSSWLRMFNNVRFLPSSLLLLYHSLFSLLLNKLRHTACFVDVFDLGQV